MLIRSMLVISHLTGHEEFWATPLKSTAIRPHHWTFGLRPNGGLEASRSKNWEGEPVKMMARLVSAEVGAARFGELAPGEVVMLLKRAREMRPIRSAYANFLMPASFVLLLFTFVRSSTGGWTVDPLLGLAATFLGIVALGQWIQSGWLPVVYSLEWSPAGLSARLLWWSDVIPPGTEVAVRVRLLSTAVRSPGGRWYPVPGEVFDRVVEARGEGGD